MSHFACADVADRNPVVHWGPRPRRLFGQLRHQAQTCPSRSCAHCYWTFHMPHCVEDDWHVLFVGPLCYSFRRALPFTSGQVIVDGHDMQGGGCTQRNPTAFVRAFFLPPAEGSLIFIPCYGGSGCRIPSTSVLFQRFAGTKWYRGGISDRGGEKSTPSVQTIQFCAKRSSKITKQNSAFCPQAGV